MALIKLQDTPLHEVKVPFDKPYLLKGYCKNMYAINRWTDQNYIRSKFNNVVFDVEVYKTVKDFEISKADVRTLDFNTYLENLHTNTGEYPSTFWTDYSGSKTYIPDCDLMEYEDEIHTDIFTDVVCPNDVRLGLKDIDGRKGIPDGLNLYIGKDTKTGMHCHIEDDFLLNQIVGKKKIYCLDFNNLHLQRFMSKYSNFSKENFFEMDWDKMDIYYAELEPGDSFCFPPWWWHAVESDGYTIGITKVWEREDQYELYKNDETYKPLRWRSWFSYGLPKWFIDFSRKYF